MRGVLFFFVSFFRFGAPNGQQRLKAVAFGQTFYRFQDVSCLGLGPRLDMFFHVSEGPQVLEVSFLPKKNSSLGIGATDQESITLAQQIKRGCLEIHRKKSG